MQSEQVELEELVAEALAQVAETAAPELSSSKSSISEAELPK
jgi:hypothetical protein